MNAVPLICDVCSNDHRTTSCPVVQSTLHPRETPLCDAGSDEDVVVRLRVPLARVEGSFVRLLEAVLEADEEERRDRRLARRYTLDVG